MSTYASKRGRMPLMPTLNDRSSRSSSYNQSKQMRNPTGNTGNKTNKRNQTFQLSVDVDTKNWEYGNIVDYRPYAFGFIQTLDAGKDVFFESRWLDEQDNYWIGHPVRFQRRFDHEGRVEGYSVQGIGEPEFQAAKRQYFRQEQEEEREKEKEKEKEKEQEKRGGKVGPTLIKKTRENTRQKEREREVVNLKIVKTPASTTRKTTSKYGSEQDWTQIVDSTPPRTPKSQTAGSSRSAFSKSIIDLSPTGYSAIENFEYSFPPHEDDVTQARAFKEPKPYSPPSGEVPEVFAKLDFGTKDTFKPQASQQHGGDAPNVAGEMKEGDAQDGADQRASKITKNGVNKVTIACRYYGSARGCSKGDSCLYAHTNPGAIRLCEEFTSKGGCQYGDNCRFRHQWCDSDSDPKVQQRRRRQSKVKTNGSLTGSVDGLQKRHAGSRMNYPKSSHMSLPQRHREGVPERPISPVPFREEKELENHAPEGFETTTNTTSTRVRHDEEKEESSRASSSSQQQHRQQKSTKKPLSPVKMPRSFDFNEQQVHRALFESTARSANSWRPESLSPPGFRQIQKLGLKGWYSSGTSTSRH